MHKSKTAKAPRVSSVSKSVFKAERNIGDFTQKTSIRLATSSRVASVFDWGRLHFCNHYHIEHVEKWHYENDTIGTKNGRDANLRNGVHEEQLHVANQIQQ